MSEMWISAKEQMKIDNYEFKDINDAIEHYPILERIHQMFNYNSEWRSYSLSSSTSLTRVVNEPVCNLSRITPSPDYKSLNRMNPKDKFYGYYVINYNGATLADRIKTGILEIRAQNANYICTCEFYSMHKLKLAKLVPNYSTNLQLEDSTILSDMMKLKKYYKISGGSKGKRDISEAYAYNMMMTIMANSEVYAPIDGSDDERYYYYAPFHTLASYFETELHYDGIIYPSSVSKGGVCVAIFNPDLIKPNPDALQCQLKVTDYL
jgi:hypothetical protein